jgi:putative spermidine/putrescine transport system permease protein
MNQPASHARRAMSDPVSAAKIPHVLVQGRRQVISQLAVVALVLLLITFLIGPLLVLFLTSFSREWYFPRLIPSQWSWRWWLTILKTPNFVHAIVLSATFAPVVTIVSAMLCWPAAYAIARYDFRLKHTFLISIFSINAFPKMGLYVAMAGFFYALHLMTTFAGVVIVQMLNTVVTMIWIPSAAFASVPRSLEEAARDAGASVWTTFWRVTLPLARPGLLVATILCFLSSWDEAQGTFLVGTPKYVTMPVQMYTLVSQYPPAAAAVFGLLLTAPSFVLLLLIRRHLFSNTLASGYRLR